jgi:hypothetical protein
MLQIDITGVSPLQYQKRLRLQEARQLINQDLDASNVRRLAVQPRIQPSFGAPPQRDIRRIRLG